ncbi:thiamine phosphate synthase [Magnetofaba australis]|uniref:thiamine phosphate synthase n=1 Tax=Magnetofaba australis TaxID=1472297 RepID=UPI000A19D5D3|nr:thiamine phosphate synthase [Magnetofaba australis]
MSRAELRTPRLLLISNAQACPHPQRWMVAAARGGARHFLLREKELSAEQRQRLAEELMRLLAPLGAHLLLHGDVALAARIGAAGVHLAESEDVAQARAALGAEALIGRSAHHLDSANAALHAGANYVTLSPLFATRSHPGAPALGAERFAQLRQQIAGPVLALGGVTPDNAAEALRAGADGVAVIRGVCAQEDPQHAAQRLIARLDAAAR